MNRKEKMVSPAKGKRSVLPLFFISLLAAFTVFLFAFDKKLRVANDYAHVHLNPDDSSPVVDTLERGHLLSLLYSGKQKKSWYYVCFKSAKTGVTKSGYILDSTVEPLFEALNSIVIKEENENRKASYAPRKFDEMKWGLSKKQILEMEGKPAHQQRSKGQDIMIYEQKVINLDCSIEYIFASNKLSQTKFRFQNSYLDKNAYLQDYQKIKEALIQRFGRPLEENLKWLDSAYKDDFSAWGEAISQGYLKLNSRWLTPQTEIVACLDGGDEEIALTVEYTDLQLRELAKKTAED